jgi:hypothetical protein
MRDPITTSMLKIDGNQIIETFHVKPGPQIGYILSILLEDVLQNPKNNTGTFLMKRTEELLKMSDIKIKKLGEESKQKIEDTDKKEIKEIRNKRKVK